MSRPSNSISFQQIQCISFRNTDGIQMQVFLEPMPKRGNYFSGQATFVIGDEITGTHYWPNLAVELTEFISRSHPNQIISKAFPKLEKYDFSTDIAEIKENIKCKFSEQIEGMPDQWHEAFNNAFDDWSGMSATKETLFFIDSTDFVLKELLGEEWAEQDIIPKAKNKDYILVKRMLREFQKALRGEMNSL